MNKVKRIWDTRPTDRQLLEALSESLQVDNKLAFAWLYTFDFDSVCDQLIDESKE